MSNLNWAQISSGCVREITNSEIEKVFGAPCFVGELLDYRIRAGEEEPKRKNRTEKLVTEVVVQKLGPNSQVTITKHTGPPSKRRKITSKSAEQGHSYNPVIILQDSPIIVSPKAPKVNSITQLLNEHES